MFGLNETNIEAIQDVFKRFQNINRVILYGSRAKGNYRNNSDVDLSLIGENINLETLLKIENELDDLLLPYNIDLSIFSKIENQDLIDHINRVGITFYDKTT